MVVRKQSNWTRKRKYQIVDMDTTQQQVGKWYILRVYFVKYDTAALSRIINLCLCAYLLCFSEKTQVDRQENIKRSKN